MLYVRFAANVDQESELTMQTLKIRESLFPIQQHGFIDINQPRYCWFIDSEPTE